MIISDTTELRIRDEEAPLVIDTSFGRLSSHHRNAIAEQLPILASQFVLFVTDEELRDEGGRIWGRGLGRNIDLSSGRKRI